MLLTDVMATGRFSCIIAGSVDAACSVLTGAASVGRCCIGFLIPTLIGNTIGEAHTAM